MDILMDDAYGSILGSHPTTRGYIYFMRNAICDESGNYHVSFGHLPISDPANLTISDYDPEDGKMLEFLAEEYPRFFVVPFFKYQSLDPDELDAQGFQFAEISYNSGGMVDTFLLADSDVGILATVKKDIGYEVVRTLAHTIERERFAQHFSDQYADYVAATDPLRKKLCCH